VCSSDLPSAPFRTDTGHLVARRSLVTIPSGMLAGLRRSSNGRRRIQQVDANSRSRLPVQQVEVDSNWGSFLLAVDGEARINTDEVL